MTKKLSFVPLMLFNFNYYYFILIIMLIKFEFCNNCVNRIYICIAIAHVYVECLSLIYSLFLLLMSRNICIKFKTILSHYVAERRFTALWWFGTILCLCLEIKHSSPRVGDLSLGKTRFFFHVECVINRGDSFLETQGNSTKLINI